MFGFVMADPKELSAEESKRYGSVYCGICRQIHLRAGSLARMGLSYDTAFLALLLMSLYEPEETCGKRACGFHPLKPRPWVDNQYIQYAADMNVALAYYNCLDDWQDDGKLRSRFCASILKKQMGRIEATYPRQCNAISQCIAQLNALESAHCADPDQAAGCFGRLMEELFVYEQDLWEHSLRQMGFSLGRFIYLADACIDYDKDLRKIRYNPLITTDAEPDRTQWEEYLIMAMGRCTEYYERLPLVQDKGILDNILYGGVWLQFRRKDDTNDR